jgi:hypothetical protein
VTPSSRPRSKPSKIAGRQQAVQAFCFLVALLAYPSAPKRKAVLYSESAVNFNQTTRRHIPENGAVNSHRHESHKYLKVK